jgi:hypothetical protein
MGLRLCSWLVFFHFVRLVSLPSLSLALTISP